MPYQIVCSVTVFKALTKGCLKKPKCHFFACEKSADARSALSTVVIYIQSQIVLCHTV